MQGGLGALEVSAGRVEVRNRQLGLHLLDSTCHLVTCALCPWQVREQVSHFYSRYLGTLGVEAAGLLEEWGGLHYLPLTSQPFLRVQVGCREGVARCSEGVGEVQGGGG